MTGLTIHNDKGRCLRTEHLPREQAIKQANQLTKTLIPGFIIIVWSEGYPTEAGISEGGF